ncbi:cytochrome C [Methanococcus voltae]|uniref:Cytochrome c heme-binding site n=2 Tax=Methanococcus voltae TaxID=2188 RepID=A0A8J7RCT3_METVO|nr:cytochrome C [Methanococcus voltae]MBP2172176.1 hypothetical protein [Methanococcus voltae]MBP2200867.1 hypothetical protein [Methanococcus voltae]MCS3921591.1 hypothetical protein [Methanococcus voltae PS]
MKITPGKVGLFAGFSAIILETMFKVTPPPAYGLCIACHTRDLTNWIVNNALGTSLGMAPVSKLIPVLTVIGVIIGALVAAKANNDFKLRTTHNMAVGFTLGLLVMNFALLMGGCPVRMALRTAYGDMIALVGLVFIAVGVYLGTEFYLKKA